MIRYYDYKTYLVNSPSRLAHSLTNAALTKDNKMNVNIIQGVMRVGIVGGK